MFVRLNNTTLLRLCQKIYEKVMLKTEFSF